MRKRYPFKVAFSLALVPEIAIIAFMFVSLTLSDKLFAGRYQMASIEDFMNHRWADAKEVLRQLDSDFVDKLENDVRLGILRLVSPPRREVIGRPKQRLSPQWHRLLEACYELVRQVDILSASVACLTEDGSKGSDPIEIAKQHDYHFRSWVIHAFTLCDHTDEVIKWSTKAYISDSTEQKNITARHRESVKREIQNRLRKLRNDYVHPANRSWSEAVTKKGYWEGCVALGITPRKHLEEFYYSDEAKRVSPGIYSEAVTETERIFECLGSILHELEADISKETAL